MKKLSIIISFCLLTVISYAQVGIGTTSPDTSSALDITATDSGLLIPRVSLINVTNGTTPIAAPATSLLIWNTNAAVVGGNGVGYYYWDTSNWVPLTTTAVTANNGLTLNGNTVQLGGSLLGGVTTVDVQGSDMRFDLNANGDFEIHDLGVKHFSVEDSGETLFGGFTYWNDEDTAGTTLASLTDDGDDDAIFNLYRNGNVQHTLHGNGVTVFNEGGFSEDFRIESNTKAHFLFVDGSSDVLYVGGNNLINLGGLPNNGDTMPNGNVVDYVASFYQGTSNGTAVQLGSTEYIMDSGNLQMSVYASWLPYYPMSSTSPFSLGSSAQRWNSVWSINGSIQTSDIKLKKNIQPLNYGLNEILQLETITYQWKESKDSKEKIGFSAQQLLDIIPEVVVTHDYQYADDEKTMIKTKNENLGVYYSDLIPVLVKAIQEQQQEIEKLKENLSNNQDLVARIIALENIVNN